MADRLPKAGPGRFYEFLKGTLEKMDFATQVRARCAPADAEAARGGRPGMEPGSPSHPPPLFPSAASVVYFKRLRSGFFAGLESARQSAARGADSLALGGFLG